MACFVLMLASLAPPADWKPVTAADGSFSAEMPVEPKVLDRSVAGPEGPIRQVVRYGKTVDGAFYSVQSIEAPAATSPEERKAKADRVHAEYLKSDGGQVVREEAVTVAGLPGWDVTLRGPTPGGGGGVVISRVRMLAGERAVYTLSVLSARDKPSPDDAGRFLDSFRLGGPGKPTPDPAGDGPEAALRSFFVAVVLGDEAKVRALALPSDGLDLLWKGKPPTPEQAPEVEKQILAQPIRSLKPGDEFTLPSKRVMAVAAGEVSGDRAVLLPEGAPTPTRMRRVDGRWRVDARPLIAARKAAESLRARDKPKAGH